MKTNNCLYIGGGFAIHTYPWLIPIIDGFCSEKGIKTLIFNKTPQKQLDEFPSLKPILSKYKILDEAKIISFWKILTRPFFIIINALVLFSNFRSRNILNKEISWHDSQILHSIFDLENLLHLGSGYPRLLSRFISCIYSAREKNRIEYLLNYKKIIAAFLGHSVYSHRVLLAMFREKDIEVVNQAAFNCHLQKKRKDTYFASLDQKKINYLKNAISREEIETYWAQRLVGKGTYDLANYAQSKKNENTKFAKNVIFLHIFKDSPFNIIDRSRIFIDYSEWFIETLKIIKDSKEIWMIKIHPSSYRWLENKNNEIKKIIKKIYKNQFLNIELIQNELANLDIFKNCNRLVTFSGTCHLEVACHGVKPITIQETQLEAFNASYVLKPANLNEYRQLLLEPSNSNIFKLKEKKVCDAKFLLFLREKILTLKEDLCQKEVYRGDDLSSAYLEELRMLKKVLPNNVKNLIDNGKNLANGFSHTFSKNYQFLAKLLIKNNLKK